MTIIARAYLLVGAERWPDPHDPLDVEFRLRQLRPTVQDMQVAAAYIEAYRNLIAMTHRARHDTVIAIRREQMELYGPRKDREPHD